MFDIFIVLGDLIFEYLLVYILFRCKFICNLFEFENNYNIKYKCILIYVGFCLFRMNNLLKVLKIYF